jgi:hypothetical protein
MSRTPEADGAQTQDRRTSPKDNAEALKESRQKLDESAAKFRKLIDIQKEIHRLERPYPASSAERRGALL